MKRYTKLALWQVVVFLVAETLLPVTGLATHESNENDTVIASCSAEPISLAICESTYTRSRIASGLTPTGSSVENLKNYKEERSFNFFSQHRQFTIASNTSLISLDCLLQI